MQMVASGLGKFSLSFSGSLFFFFLQSSFLKDGQDSKFEATQALQQVRREAFMCLLKWSFGISSVTYPKLLTSIAFISPKIISGFSLVEISFLQCAFEKQDNKYLKERACKVHIGWIHGKAKLKVTQSNYCEAFDILFFGSIIWSEWNTIPVSCPERFPAIFINTFFYNVF